MANGGDCTPIFVYPMELSVWLDFISFVDYGFKVELFLIREGGRGERGELFLCFPKIIFMFIITLIRKSTLPFSISQVCTIMLWIKMFKLDFEYNVLIFQCSLKKDCPWIVFLDILFRRRNLWCCCAL